MKTVIHKFRIPVMPNRGKGSPEMAEYVADSWNDTGMIQFFDINELNNIVIGLSADHIGTNVFIYAACERELLPKEIRLLQNWITGQCSDGWGEGLEQEEYEEGIYIRTWSRTKCTVYKGIVKDTDNEQ